MWTSDILKDLENKAISLSKKEELLRTKRTRFLSAVKSLNAEGIIYYLFNSKIPKTAKKLICEEVNMLSLKDDETSRELIEKIKTEFINRIRITDSLLNAEYCPNNLKRVVIEEVYGSNLVNTITSKNLPTARKKLIIELCLPDSSAKELLEAEISDELKSFIINKRINQNTDILACIKSDKISDSLKEKIIQRKINITNIFQILRDSLPEERMLIEQIKEKTLEEFVNTLTPNTILSAINNFAVPISLVYKIIESKLDILEKAIIAAPKKEIARSIRIERSKTVIDLILQKRRETVFELMDEQSAQEHLIWLSNEHIPEQLKRYIMLRYSQKIDHAIENHQLINVSFRFLRRDRFLPLEILEKIFESYKDDFIREYEFLSDDQVISKIKFGEECELLRNLLISLKINETNIVSLLQQAYLSSAIIDNVFIIKKDCLNEMIKNLSIEEIIRLDSMELSVDLKNRILDTCSETVQEKLKEMSREQLLNYLKDDSILYSVKRSIINSFGIKEVDVKNCLEVLTAENASMLIDNYERIKEFINASGIDFESFIKYGSGSKKYSDWLINLIDILNNEQVSDFTKVKEYFFNSYYSEYLEKENNVYNISNFLELIVNFNRYNELCLSLANANQELSREDILNINFLFNSQVLEGVEVPKTLEELSQYKKKLYEGYLEKITSEDLSLEELKKIFNDSLLYNTTTILNSIGGTATLRTIRKDNIGSESIYSLATELMLYSSIIEMINDTNNKEGLIELLDYVFTDIETLTIIQNIFSQFDKKVTKLYELDSKYNLTSLEKAREIPGVIDKELSIKYGGEVFDFSDKNYALYAHVLSFREDIESFLIGRATGKSNFISVSPISYKGQKYYWDRSELIFAYDKIPTGSFVCSSINNMGTNRKINSNSTEVTEFSRNQRGILETSAVVENNSEALLYREGLKPCGLILPGGREPTPLEMEYHLKYNLPFIITQDIMEAVTDPKEVLPKNDNYIYRSNPKTLDVLKGIIGILEPNVKLEKETEEFTGREIALFTDSHSMYEPTLAVLEDIRRHGITEIYSLGDNVGNGPNPVEVFDLLEEYGVISIAGNSEYYNTLGIEPFTYFDEAKAKSQEWTRQQLGDERVSKLKLYKASIDIVLGNKKIALCHFANDVRWDYRNNSSRTYRENFGTEDASSQFLYTNSEDANKKINDSITSHKKGAKEAKGYVSAKEEPLFDGKLAIDYDTIIQGHLHFDRKDNLAGTDIYTLRAAGMGYEEDAPNTACYYVLKEKKTGGFELERRLIPFNKNSLLSSIYSSSLPNKEGILKYVKTK